MQQKSLCASSDQLHLVVSTQHQTNTSFIIVWNYSVSFFTFKLGMCEFCQMAETFPSLYLISAIKVFYGIFISPADWIIASVTAAAPRFYGWRLWNFIMCSQLSLPVNHCFLTTLCKTRQQHQTGRCFQGSLCFWCDRRGRREVRNTWKASERQTNSHLIRPATIWGPDGGGSNKVQILCPM